MAIDRRHRPALALLCLLAILALAWAPAARADALDDRVRAIGKELRCPVCAGETVADSNAALAVQMRGVIRQKLEAGETADQIKAYFVARWGPEILLTPPTSGFTLGVWIMPIVALLIGLGVVFAVLRNWSRRDADDSPPPSAPESTAPSLSEGDDARLEEELARFRGGRTGEDRVAG